MTDLAYHHYAIEKWADHDFDQRVLTEQQVAEYWRDGFLIGIPVLTDDEVDRIVKEVDEMTSDPDHEGRENWYEYYFDADSASGTQQGYGGWRVRQSLHDLIFHPRIASAIAQLMQAEPRLLFDGLFWKPAGQKGAVNWHQDYSYWTYTQPMNHVTCWIALDDADVSNGCVQYIPGSHRWDLLLQRPTTFNKRNTPKSVRDQLTSDQAARFKPVSAEVKRGSVLLHHPLTIHGSLPNISDRARRGCTIHSFADGTRAAEDLPEIDGIPGWLLGGAGRFYPVSENPDGPVLGGRYFPLLRKAD